MPENETPTQTRPQSRTQKIEQFLLDPEKVIFESLEEFQQATQELLDILSGVDLESLEKIEGKNGYTPVRGKDYFTQQDLESFERFILDKMPREGIDYPTRMQVTESIRTQVAEVSKRISDQVAAIPRIKGDKGDKGNDGSPDTPQDIVKKIRSIKNTNQALKIGDIRGLRKVLEDILGLEGEIENLRKEFSEIKFVVSPQGGSEGGGTGLTAEEVRDTIATAFEAATHTGITFTHDDALNTFTLAVDGGAGLTEEQVEDIVNGLIIGGTGITATYNDAANSLTISLTGEEFTTGYKTILDYITLTGAINLDTIKTKTDFITVTQPVDLDQMETDIAALANGMVYAGDWDASAGTFPGGGTAKTGAFYYVSVAGTVDGIEFAIGDNIVATTDNASTTVYAANWSKHDQTDAVQAVAGLTGSISASALRSALNVEDGADVTDAVNVGAVNAAAASKTTPVDADSFPIVNSESANVIGRVTFTNFKAFLKTYIDAMTSTFTNKTIIAPTNVVEEITTTASSATPTPTGGSLRNYFSVTALAANATIAAPTGTPVNGNKLFIRIKDNGTARTLAYNSIFRAIGVTLPTTTVISKTIYLGCMYNSADSKWDVLAVAEEEEA